MRGAALVTGGARRIGRALSLALASAGYDIAVHHRRSHDDARTLVREIEVLGRRAVVLEAELTRDQEVERLIPEARAALGPLTLLVNNASVFEHDRLGGLTRERWDRHFDANLRAPILLSQAFAAQDDWPDGADPLILNILDQRVLKPNPQFFSYTLTKAALWTATRMMAQALAPRIRVNGIGPGPTFPSIHQTSETFAAEAAALPLGRGSDVKDICGAALYLIDARAVTGQMIAVDGGQHLAWKTPDILDD